MKGQSIQPITDEERWIVARLAAEGIPQRTIVRFVKRKDAAGVLVPISVDALQDHFRAELDEGREIADAQLISKAYELAMAGNPQMVIHMTKVRLGWREPAQGDPSRQTYGDLVKEAHDAAKPATALQMVKGGRGQ